MNLQSCDSCGVVIDIDKVSFPDDFETSEGIDVTKAMWNREDREWVPCIKCPCCQWLIPKKRA